MGTPPGQREYLPISMTLKGQRLLDKVHNRSQGKSRKNNWYKKLKRVSSRIEVKAALGLAVTLLGSYISYKYASADELRSKVYSPLNSELATIEASLYANSVDQPFVNNALNSLKQSGQFYRVPKSLQLEITTFYADASQLQGNVANLTELLQRHLSSKIQAIRSEQSDREWRQGATNRIRAQEQRQSGISAIRSFTFNHAFRGRGMDVRNPNNPIISSPGGPIWVINDWLSYPESIEKVSAIWTDSDFLYFDESRDLWYYRVTRYDLQEQHATLKNFLEPVHQVLLKDENFKAIQTRQPELLKRLANLKTKVADRMDDPKRLMDLFD